MSQFTFNIHNIDFKDDNKPANYSRRLNNIAQSIKNDTERPWDLIGLNECYAKRSGTYDVYYTKQKIDCIATNCSNYSTNCFAATLRDGNLVDICEQVGEIGIIARKDKFERVNDTVYSKRLGYSMVGTVRRHVLGIRLRHIESQNIVPFFCTHISGFQDKWYKKDQAHNQLEDLVSAIKEWWKPGDLLPIVVGDFNSDIEHWNNDDWQVMKNDFELVEEARGENHKSIEHIWIGRQSSFEGAHGSYLIVRGDYLTKYNDKDQEFNFTDHSVPYCILSVSTFVTLYPQSVVTMIPFKGGIITAFSGKGIYKSPDGKNVVEKRVYSDNQSVVAMVPYKNGVMTAFSGKGIYSSADGNTIVSRQAYSGNQSVVAMIPYKNGVITAFSGKGIYLSPDGNNITSERVYDGDQSVVAMIPFKDGVITAFSGKGIYKSPDGKNLGGGGNTKRSYSGNQSVVAMVPYKNGVMTAFSGKGIYSSADGNTIASRRAYSGNQSVVAMIPYKNGVITAFSGKGIYLSPDGNNITSERVYDGDQSVVAMIPFKDGVITAFSDSGIYFSPDGNNLGGGGNTVKIYP